MENITTAQIQELYSLALTVDKVQDFHNKKVTGFVPKTTVAEFNAFVAWAKESPLQCESGKVTNFFVHSPAMPTVTVEAWFNALIKANTDIQALIDYSKVIKYLYKTGADNFPVMLGHRVYEIPKITYEYLDEEGFPLDWYDGFLSGGRHRFVMFATYALASGIDLSSEDFWDSLIPVTVSLFTPESIVTNNSSRSMTSIEKTQVFGISNGLSSDPEDLLRDVFNKVKYTGKTSKDLIGLAGYFIAVEKQRNGETVTSLQVYAALYSRFYQAWLKSVTLGNRPAEFPDTFERFYSVFLTLFEKISIYAKEYQSNKHNTEASNLTKSRSQLAINEKLITSYRKNQEEWETKNSPVRIEGTLQGITDLLEKLPTKTTNPLPVEVEVEVEEVEQNEDKSLDEDKSLTAWDELEHPLDKKATKVKVTKPKSTTTTRKTSTSTRAPRKIKAI